MTQAIQSDRGRRSGGESGEGRGPRAAGVSGTKPSEADGISCYTETVLAISSNIVRYR